MAAKKAPGLILILIFLASGASLLLRNVTLPDREGAEANGFREYLDCTLVSDSGNDGDSFRVRCEDGQVRHLRLYFVDAPETSVKRYADGNTNVKRLGYQAEYFGGLSQEETVEIGQEARAWVRERLAAAETFAVATRGEEVYDSGRIYALVRVSMPDGSERWLHELLVEAGLVRIYTMGTDLPDGTSRSAQKRRLHLIEQDARAAKKGAWGLASGRNGS